MVKNLSLKMSKIHAKQAGIATDAFVTTTARLQIAHSI